MKVVPMKTLDTMIAESLVQAGIASESQARIFVSHCRFLESQNHQAMAQVRMDERDKHGKKWWKL